MPRSMAVAAAALVVLAALHTSAAAEIQRKEVSYDGRALIVDGTRRMLFSGEMHYTRSTPEMWPTLIAKAKEGGLDVIQTYVFWNVHEPVKGQYNFMGRYDLVKFIKEIQAQGLYASLRMGPFIEAEWKYGGLPFWLHDVPNITFRSDNEPFKEHMQRFVTQIVNMMKHEGLYYAQGGPIIISQIENEYQMVERAFGSSGSSYVRWAAAMAINSCNGLTCGETFSGPNSPNKPALWTENWTSRFLTYGSDTQLRSPEDIAFAVALFIARKKGSFVNYYMYHGGTNFGRSASSYVTTSYYDGAPLDEYGLIWQPTWGHLRELHAAVKQLSEPLLFGEYSNFSLGQKQEVHVFETESNCVAFLVNFDNSQMSRSVHGSHDEGDNIILKMPISLKEGQNTISLLNVMVGSPDSGAHMERRVFGIRKVTIQKGKQTQLLNNRLWGYQVGLFGERNYIYTQEGSRNIEWATINDTAYHPLTWYKATFATPAGNDPVALNLVGMGKGEVWINGESIGRYWVSLKAPSGNPSQSLYHIPRQFLKPQGNILVLFEEMGGNPRQITVNTVSVKSSGLFG
nr:unnamed protein product [Digitaria exilis]